MRTHARLHAFAFAVFFWFQLTHGTTLGAPSEFAIRDQDTVVFLGDSITAARTYGKIIENYSLLRFPERRARFLNAGRGGETAQGAVARLESDVFAQGATVLTVAYGVNDIGWGTKADAAHKQAYLDGIAEIVSRCQERGVRVFVCSAAITAEDPDKAEAGFLQAMCDEGLALAQARGADTIDVQRGMRRIQRRILAANAKLKPDQKPTHLHVEDGVHLNDLGQMAMAFVILKGLGAPAQVSAAVLDARENKVLRAEGCRVQQLKATSTPAGTALAFTRRDEHLPMNLHPLWMLQGWHIPISEELNQYLLEVRHLPEGEYRIVAGKRPLGTWSAAQLARGINLASATPDPWVPGGLWDAQGHAVKLLTDMRDELDRATRLVGQTMTAHPRLKALRRKAASLEKDLVALQRDVARPVAIEVEILPVKPSSTQADDSSDP